MEENKKLINRQTGNRNEAFLQLGSVTKSALKHLNRCLNQPSALALDRAPQGKLSFVSVFNDLR